MYDNNKEERIEITLYNMFMNKLQAMETLSESCLVSRQALHRFLVLKNLALSTHQHPPR